MKKFLGIVVLGLLWCNVGFAQCIKGDCNNGQGTYRWESGDEYVGEWKDGKRHGQGTQTQQVFRTKYVGEWKDGEFNGQGTLTYINGTVEKGIWKDGNIVERQ